MEAIIWSLIIVASFTIFATIYVCLYRKVWKELTEETNHELRGIEARETREQLDKELLRVLKSKRK